MAAKARSKRARAIQWPELPESVVTALGQVPVRRVAVIPADDGTTPTHDLGYADYHKRVILIREGLDPVAAWHTLFHEQAHFYCFDLGLKLSDDAEETVADIIATMRVQEMLAGRL